MTTAQVFAEVVGLKPETAGWAYEPACPKCRLSNLLPVIHEAPNEGDFF